MDLSHIIILLAQLSTGIPIIVGLIYYKQLPITARYFLLFLILSAINEGVAVLMGTLLGNNMPLMYLFTALEFAAFCLVFFPKLKAFKSRFKTSFVVAMLVMLVLLVIDLMINTIWQLNTISKISECLLIVLIGLTYLLQYLQSDTSTNITKDYLFWIASGATLYFAISFFFFVTLNILVSTNNPMAQITSSGHCIASTLANILYAYSFVVAIKNKQQ